MKYQCLLFDADNTLFDFDKAEEYALKNVLEHFEIFFDDLLVLKFYREISSEIWQELEKSEITIDELKVERFRRLFQKLGISEHSAGKISELYLEYLSQGVFLMPHALDVVSGFSKRTNLAIITNGISQVQHARFADSPLVRYFDKMVVSGDVGMTKPDPRIFDYTLNLLGITDKSTVLMVGDSLTSDIAGGISCGIDTCWFNPADLPNNSGPAPSYEISDLRELQEIAEVEKVSVWTVFSLYDRMISINVKAILSPAQSMKKDVYKR